MIRLVGEWRLGNCPDIVLRLRGHPGQTTRRLHEHKWNSRHRLLFGYFFRSFPEASLADFRRLFLGWAQKLPFSNAADLRCAGDWLVRLSRLPEIKLRERMARRWNRACELYAGPAGDADALRCAYAEAILAAP